MLDINRFINRKKGIHEISTTKDRVGYSRAMLKKKKGELGI
jgi:hypothetical protein